MTVSFLAGEKVALRGLRRDDLARYRGWLENPEATRFMESGWRPVSDAEIEEIYAASTERADTVVFVIVDSESDTPVGVCGLHLIHWICRRAEFRILIGDDAFRGKGIGAEAARLTVAYGFDKLNLETIYLGVNADNKGAIGSYEKAGFVREGIRRQLIYRNGRYYDALMMSILRDEYLAGKAPRHNGAGSPDPGEPDPAAAGQPGASNRQGADPLSPADGGDVRIDRPSKVSL